MNLISFNSANFVAREVGYHMPGGWGEGDSAANQWFLPIATFGERFDAMLGEVQALGFSAIDIWTGHINYAWATQEHIDIASSVLAARNMRAVTYAGGPGSTIEENRAVCKLCHDLGMFSISGGDVVLLKSNREALVANLREFGVKFGYENHPEGSVDEILAKIGDDDSDVLGVTIDTGWFGTNRMNGAATIRALSNRLFYIHMKDVKARRKEKTGFRLIDMGHETCRFGEGIVNIEACAKTLIEIGYNGPISIEHEPEDFDPREDVKASKLLLDGWLRGA